MTWAEVARLTLCLLTPEMQNRRIIDQLMREAGGSPQTVLESNSIILLYDHVKAGRWATVMPEKLAQALGVTAPLRAIPILEPEAVHEVGLVAPQREPAQPMVAALLAETREARRERSIRTDHRRFLSIHGSWPLIGACNLRQAEVNKQIKKNGMTLQAVSSRKKREEMPQVAWDPSRAQEIIDAHLHLEGPAMPILHALQEEFGCVPEAAVPQIAEALNVSRAEMHGVVTFYHDFRREPAGRHVLKICRAESCQSMGSEKIAREFLQRIKTDWHHTTPDGALTVEAVYCLGLCAHSPSALFDGEPIGRVDDRSSTRSPRRRASHDEGLRSPRHGRQGDGRGQGRRSDRQGGASPRAKTFRSCATARAACCGWSPSLRSRRRKGASATAM